MAEQRSNVATLVQQINREVLAVFEAVQVKNDRLRGHKAAVEARIREQSKLRHTQDLLRDQYNHLVDEAKNTQDVYESVLSRLKEVEIVADYATTNVHTIGAAVVSDTPVRPRPLAAIAIALLAGLLLAGITAFVLDAMDNTIKSSPEAEQVLGIPVVGVVPRMRGVRSQAAIDEKSLDPESNVAEAFRTIRTNLLLSKRAHRLNSFVVTSTGAGEGKSLVALNLAASFARAGHRVLLVDAEMRRPRLHEALNIHCVEGFSSVLVDERKVEQVAFETDEDNLFFMPCGVLPSNPLELLTIGMSTKVRRDLADFFDLVVFDSPPVGIVSDACMLASAADQVLFVVRTFAADRIQSQRAIKNLQDTGANVSGLIVNHVDSKAERGRHLDFTYDSSYASLPSPELEGPQSMVADFDSRAHEDEQFDFQLSELEDELENAISNLSEESEDVSEDE
jgi:capsular exopolysaccharide synthesis family protein